MRERGTGRIFEEGRYFWIQYYSRGEQVRRSTKVEIPSDPEERVDALKKVEKKLRKALAEVSEGTARDTRRLTYEELRDAYYSDYLTNRRKSLRQDAHGKPYLDKVGRLDDFFSGWRVSEIDTDSLRKFITDQQKKGLSNGSINRSLSALRRMFNLAAEDDKLRHVPRFPMLKEAAPRQGFFEREQYDALSHALPDHLRLPLALGYFTAMRLGEILALEWEQIDFIANSISLRAGETKNDAARSIPIVPQLRTLLAEQHAKRRKSCALVCFRLDDGGRAARIGGFRKAWYSACIKAGLGKMVPVNDPRTGQPFYARPRGPRSKAKVKMEYEGMIFHDLRRTGVRNLVRAGVPERVAQAISGHKTRSVFERYNIVSGNDVADAGRKLATFHSQNFGENSGRIETQEPQGPQLIQ